MSEPSSPPMATNLASQEIDEPYDAGHFVTSVDFRFVARSRSTTTPLCRTSTTLRPSLETSLPGRYELRSVSS